MFLSSRVEFVEIFIRFVSRVYGDFCLEQVHGSYYKSIFRVILITTPSLLKDFFEPNEKLLLFFINLIKNLTEV